MEPIQAGAGFWDTLWNFLVQFENAGYEALHFYYAKDINDFELQRRRDNLIEGWNSTGALTGECPVTQ